MQLAAEVERPTNQVADLQQTHAERGHADDGGDRPPLYSTVEERMFTYLLPTFPRLAGGSACLDGIGASNGGATTKQLPA